jgi:hypothetical protein
LTLLTAVVIGIALSCTVVSLNQLLACPFCSAINLTFTEQLSANDVVVIAKLLEVPPPSDDPDAELPKAEFEIVDIVKGEKWVTEGMKFRTLLVGRYPLGQQFLVMGVDPPSVAWSTPMKASERLVEYLKKLQTLPKNGPDRLAFFQDYFEDKESVLAFDAYDEFARAPYQELVALKDRMHHDQLVEWIKDPETSINRRRLYFTMLGVCGGSEDVPFLEELLKSGDRKKQAGLDALIACYLNLKGGDGVALIEDTFLKDNTVDYVDTLSAVSALRFHGTEVDLVPKERIVAAIRQLLDRPKMADMIIPDLARWEDWSVMDRLVKMFKEADEDTNWLRVPVITYLRACPKPEAKAYIEELSKIDPDAVRRADFFLDFGDDETDTSGGNKDDTTQAEQAVDKGDSDDPAASGSGGQPTTNGKGRQENSPISIVAPQIDDENESYLVKKVPISTGVNSPYAGNVQVDGLEEATLTKADSSPDKTAGLERMAEMATSDSLESPVQVAQNLAAPAPVAAAAKQPGLTLMVIFIPMAISAAIFLLLWSVISGGFERLIV